MNARLIQREPDPLVRGQKLREPHFVEWHSLLSKVHRIDTWYEVHPPYASPGAAATTAYDINTGRIGRKFPDGRWEACARTRYIDGAAKGILFVRKLKK